MTRILTSCQGERILRQRYPTLTREKRDQGRNYDGPSEAQRLGLGGKNTRGVDRPGGDARDHRSPLERSARRRPRVPGGRQRAGHSHAGEAPPRSESVLPLLLPLERGWLDTLGGGGRAGGSRSSRLLLAARY